MWHRKKFLNFGCFAGIAALATLMCLAILEMPAEPSGLTDLALSLMPESGVEHPVTAVLLNFRAYDTWLELGILLLGALGIFAVRGEASLQNKQPQEKYDTLLYFLVSLLAPVMLLVGGYLLWLGKFSLGGAFQSGVVLGATGVLLWLAGFRSITGLSENSLRVALTAGFFVFLIVASITAITGGAPLALPFQFAGDLILLLEIAAAFSIGLTIPALLIALRPASHIEKRKSKNGDESA